MDRLGGFALGFGTATIIALMLFAVALYEGRLVRGNYSHENDYLPSVFKERHAKKDTMGNIIARAE